MINNLSNSILLPGRSYGNQDREVLHTAPVAILLPGRSYGNQDRGASNRV